MLCRSEGSYQSSTRIAKKYILIFSKPDASSNMERGEREKKRLCSLIFHDGSIVCDVSVGFLGSFSRHTQTSKKDKRKRLRWM